MNAMNKFYEICFSPTGGTSRVSKILAASLTGEASGTAAYGETVSLDLIKAIREGEALPEFAADDVCLISVPSFAGLVPLPAVKWLAGLKGNGAKAVLNVVYGNRAIDDTLLELRDVLEEAGFTCAAAMETVAEHSIFRQFGAGRPDQDDEAELKDFARQIGALLQKAASGAEGADLTGRLQVPGNYPYRERKPAGMIPVGSEGCTGCGICAAECPVHAISADAPAETSREVCFGCMRCVSVCPGGHRDVPAELREKMLPHMSQVCSGRKENRLYTERK